MGLKWDEIANFYFMVIQLFVELFTSFISAFSIIYDGNKDGDHTWRNFVHLLHKILFKIVT